MLMLSCQWKVTSWSFVGPCGLGPRLKLVVVMIGGAVPAGSSGKTLVNPSAAGEVLSCGTPCKVALRLAAKMNSLITVGLKLCSQEMEPSCVRVRVVKPEPKGTLPPEEAPFTI